MLEEIINRQNLLNFINREEPQRIFNDLICAWKNIKLDYNGRYLLNFHGVAGKGKTELHNKLSENLRENHPDLKQIRWDARREITSSYNIPEILLVLRNELVKEYKYTFTEFDQYIFYYNYALNKDFKLIFYKENKDYKNIGAQVFKSGMKVFFELIGIRAILEESTEVLSKVRGMSKNKIIEERLKRFTSLSENEKLKLMLNSFINEFNQQNTDYPVCIFIDTLEDIFTEKLSWLFSNEKNTLWGCRGLFNEMESIIWIVSGRDPISFNKWSILNGASYVLNNFTEKDNQFFIESNIGTFTREEVKEIWCFTEGNPMLLKALQDIYIETQSKDTLFREIELSKYNKGKINEALLERYIRYLKYDQGSKDNRNFSELLKVFVCLGSWQVDVIEEIEFKNLVGSKLDAVDIKKYINQIYSKSIIKHIEINFVGILGIDPIVQKVLLNSTVDGEPIISNSFKTQVLNYLIKKYTVDKSVGLNNFHQISMLVFSIHQDKDEAMIIKELFNSISGIVLYYLKNEMYYYACELMILFIGEANDSLYRDEYVQKELSALLEDLIKHELYDLIPLLESKIHFTSLSFENKVSIIVLYRKSGQYSNAIEKFEELISTITGVKSFEDGAFVNTYAYEDNGRIKIIKDVGNPTLKKAKKNGYVLFNLSTSEARIIVEAFESYILSNIYLSEKGDIEGFIFNISLIGFLLDDLNIKLKYSLLVLEVSLHTNQYWDLRLIDYFIKQTEFLMLEGRELFKNNPRKLLLLFNAGLAIFETPEYHHKLERISSFVLNFLDENQLIMKIPQESDYMCSEYLFLMRQYDQLEPFYKTRVANDFVNIFSERIYVNQAYLDLKLSSHYDDLLNMKMLFERYIIEFQKKFGNSSLQLSKLYTVIGDCYYVESEFGTAAECYDKSLEILRKHLEEDFERSRLVLEPRTRYFDAKVREIQGSYVDYHSKYQQYLNIYEDIIINYKMVLNYIEFGLPFASRIIYTHDYIIDIMDSFFIHEEYTKLFQTIDNKVNLIQANHPLLTSNDATVFAAFLTRILYVEQYIHYFVEHKKYFFKEGKVSTSDLREIAEKSWQDDEDNVELFDYIFEYFLELIIHEDLEKIIFEYLEIFKKINNDYVADVAKNDTVFRYYILLRNDYLSNSNYFKYNILKKLQEQLDEVSL